MFTTSTLRGYATLAIESDLPCPRRWDDVLRPIGYSGESDDRVVHALCGYTFDSIHIEWEAYCREIERAKRHGGAPPLDVDGIVRFVYP